MNYTYLLAVVGNRAISLVCVVVLSYLLPSEAFGVYALTATNALVIEILFASWLATSAAKYLAISSDGERAHVIASLAVAMLGLFVLAGVVIAAGFLIPFAGFSPAQLAMLLGWSVALMVYDVTLASKNALGQAGSYAALALVRNLGAVALSVILVIAGYGATGAILGQILGTLVPTLALRSSLRIWGGVRFSEASVATLREMFRFGVAATMGFGFYMIFHAGSRNIVGQFMGEAQAGHLVLATDLFFAPIALLGTGYSLSKSRELYIAETSGDRRRKQEKSSAFLRTILCIAIPYATGAAIVGPDAVRLILSSSAREDVAAIAIGASVLGAVMLVMYGITTLLTVMNKRRYLFLGVLGTASVNIALQFALARAGYSLPALVWASTAVLAAASLVLLMLGYVRGFLRTPMLDTMKILLAAGVMGAAVMLYRRFVDTGEPFSAAILGCAVFIVAGMAMKVLHPRELLPIKSA